jgi:5-methylcytosine-specific restriction endonuclease McrBC regulatory subunit McrC
LIESDRAGRLLPRRDDLLQMLGYAAAYHCRDLALVYPWSPHLAIAVDTSFEVPLPGGEAVNIHVLCVDVHQDALPVALGCGKGRVGALMGLGFC